MTIKENDVDQARRNPTRDESLQDRKNLLERLQEELTGPMRYDPDRHAKAIFDPSKSVPLGGDHFKDWKDANGPWFTPDHQEILWQREAPLKRYGCAVLNPKEGPLVTDGESVSGEAENGDDGAEIEVDGAAAPEAPNNSEPTITGGAPPDDDDLELSLTNIRRPAAMAISFLFDATVAKSLRVDLPESHPKREMPVNGCYKAIGVSIAKRRLTWWYRRQTSATWNLDIDQAATATKRYQAQLISDRVKLCGIDLICVVVIRPVKGSASQRLVTVSLVNQTPRDDQRKADERSLFQTWFRVCCSARPRFIDLPRNFKAFPPLTSEFTL